MSETEDMWDRFFRGSKYERKWTRTKLREQAVDLGFGTPAEVEEWLAFPPETRSHEIDSWLARLQAERNESAPTALRVNPFDGKPTNG